MAPGDGSWPWSRLIFVNAGKIVIAGTTARLYIVPAALFSARDSRDTFVDLPVSFERARAARGDTGDWIVRGREVGIRTDMHSGLSLS